MVAPFLSYVVLDVPSITQKAAFMGVFKGLTGLEMNFEVQEYREGGNNDYVHRLPGRITYPNLVLFWGLVNDDALLQWFVQTQSQAQRQDITLTLTASTSDLSQNVRKFAFTDAFPVRWSGPQLNGAVSNPETWGESLEIAHSGLKLSP
jgi:phage tail-like protein